jgi:hypothetical protein
MAINRLVSTQEFNQMQSYKVYANNRQEQQVVKLKLLEVVKKAYGDSYYRLKQGTKDAIEMMCWLAADRGFFFIEDKTLADRYGVSDKTIRNIEKTLRKNNVIMTVYRRSTKQNGLGNQVHLFVDHPYFDYWVNFLQLDEIMPQFQADFLPENQETPCESKTEDKKKISTYDLTLNNFIKHNKRKEDNFLNSDFVPSYVPERFILAVQPFFENAQEIYRLWGKVRLAHKISRLDMPVEELLPLVIQAFKGSVFAYKHNKVKKAFTGYFFGSLRNMFAAAKRREYFHNGHTNSIFYNFLEV